VIANVGGIGGFCGPGQRTAMRVRLQLSVSCQSGCEKPRSDLNVGGASAPRPAQPETQHGRGAEAPPTFSVCRRLFDTSNPPALLAA